MMRKELEKNKRMEITRRWRQNLGDGTKVDKVCLPYHLQWYYCVQLSGRHHRYVTFVTFKKCQNIDRLGFEWTFYCFEFISLYNKF